MVTQIGIKIEYDLKLMKQNRRYNQGYIVNRRRIFDYPNADLLKIFEEFPNRENIARLVLELKG